MDRIFFCKRCGYSENSNDHSKSVMHKFPCSFLAFLCVNNGIEQEKKNEEEVSSDTRVHIHKEQPPAWLEKISV